MSPENKTLDAQVIRLERKHRFTLFAELQATCLKDWLVHNFLGCGEASAMYGKPGDGKSVLAEDLALHVAAGWPWHGREVRRGAVLYIALERRQLVERRAIAFREHYNEPDLPFAVIGGMFDLRDPRAVAAVVEIVREVEAATGEAVVLIVIDTLSRALCGGDENSPKDMGAIVNATSRLQEDTKAHTLWVHHMPVESERMRGHGALLGALDTTIHVAKADAVRSATVVKTNDGPEGESVAFTLDSVTIGPDTTAPIVVPCDAPSWGPTSRKLSDRQRLAIEALTECILKAGTPTPAAFQLPANIKAVPVDTWRDELFCRGVLDKDAANPRQDFRRVRIELQARNLIGERDGIVWPA